MKSIFEQMNEIIDTSQSQVSACFKLSDTMIEEIFQAGVYHGLFKKQNSGINDRKNSVYGLIGTLCELKSK